MRMNNFLFPVVLSMFAQVAGVSRSTWKKKYVRAFSKMFCLVYFDPIDI